MSKFKALFYKEFIISKKLILTNVIVMIGIMVFGWLVVLSTEYGNFKTAFEVESDAEMIKIMKMIIYYSCDFIVMFYSNIFFMDNRNPFSDIITNWRAFSFTLPVSNRQKAAVRIFFKLCTIILGFALSMFNVLVLSEFSGNEADFSLNINIYFILLAFIQFLDLSNAYFVYRARTTKEANISLIAFVAMGIALGLVAVPHVRKFFSNQIPIELLPDIVDKINSVGVWAIVLNIVLIIVNFLLTNHAMKRRYE